MSSRYSGRSEPRRARFAQSFGKGTREAVDPCCVPRTPRGRARARNCGCGGGEDHLGQEVRQDPLRTIQGVSNTIDQIQPATGGDLAATHAQILASTDQLLDSLNTAKAKAAKISPDDGGKKVTKIFDQYFQNNIDGVTAAREKLAAADPNNVAFAADIAQFSAALQTLEATTGDPFAKLASHQDLLQALKKEQACSQIVTVYGG